MRITKKSDYHFEHYNANTTLPYILNKLGQLEDIEDEKTISLKVLVRLLESQEELTGIYIKDGRTIIKKHIRYLVYSNHIKEFMYLASKTWDTIIVKKPNERYRFEFKDYGKTWALTKEELL